MTSPVIGTPWKKLNAPVSEEALEGVDKYWRVANYLSIGQIYLRSNPLMKEPFTREDVKHRLVGHWGTTPGLNFLIGHINRFIADHGQNTVFIMGPGHGGPAGTSQSYLDGTYTETYPNITKDEAGLQKFFRQFSYPGGIPSHFAPETPGSIHEGGELGYALSHAYGAIMDNPSLFVPCIVGDGEAETGPLATGWQSNKLVNPRTDGIVLPILHLNGYKIANPTILSRISDEELHEFFHGMGYEPYEFVAGFDDEDHMSIHRRFAELFESVWDEICDIKAAANTDNMHRPFYPMIIFRTPKGWTCPKYIDGKKTEGSWRAHQVPLASARDTEAHFEVLQAGRAVRRQRRRQGRRPGLHAEGRAAHRRQPERQRWRDPQGSRAAGARGLRGQGSQGVRTRLGPARGHPSSGRLHPRHHQEQPGLLPYLRTG
jgi:xylulose-5-phosphate/fructose-6-phosphate phosphoketolase